MKYRTKELDIAMLLLPQDGDLGASEQISDKTRLGIYNYLKSKKLVTLKYKKDDTIREAGLTDEGIAFIVEGGFIAEEFNKNHEKQREKEKQHWEWKQRKKVRRVVFWSALIATIIGFLVGLYLQYHLQIL
ncbi:hypothetical protein ACFLTA_08610 [Bacteroidota bacterium]